MPSSSLPSNIQLQRLTLNKYLPNGSANDLQVSGKLFGQQMPGGLEVLEL
jgi:hypothetical protein